MRKLLKKITVGIVLVTASTFTGQVMASPYNSKECKASIHEIFDNTEKGNLTLKSESFLPIYGGFGDSGTITGYESWFSFNECRGNLVIHVNKSCTFAQVYTTTECEIEGIPHY